MKLTSKMIGDVVNTAYEEAQEKEEQENIEFIRNCDIAICIKVSEYFDRYSLADRLEDILDNIPAVDDMTMYIK